MKPGARDRGKTVTIRPADNEIVTVGPVTIKDDGSRSFTVTIAPAGPDMPGQYL